ncbi:MAG: pilus assembly protein [Planctomycetia bacterium]|nr:pilus assembly protein [Planctomycetia bacterium]
MKRRKIPLCSRQRRRLGAVLSMELIFVLPILLALIFASVEFGMLWSSGRRVEEAAAAGCRTASFRGADDSAIRRSIERTLDRTALVKSYAVNVRRDLPNANEVCVTVSVPMKAAAPDMLGIIGFALGSRTIVAQSVMRKE